MSLGNFEYAAIGRGYANRFIHFLGLPHLTPVQVTPRSLSSHPNIHLSTTYKTYLHPRTATLLEHIYIHKLPD